MGPSKGGTGKGRVTSARVVKTDKTSAMSGKGAGVNKRDAAKAGAGSKASGGSTLRYRSGDVKRSVGSFAKYK